MALKSRSEGVLFLLIAPQTERLQVANVVRTASRQWNDMVNTEMHLYLSLPTASALIAIALKHIFPYLWRNPNARGFTHKVVLMAFCLGRVLPNIIRNRLTNIIQG